MKTQLTRRHMLGSVLAAGCAPLLARPTFAASALPPQDIAALGAPDRALEARLRALAAGMGQARIGIAALDLEAGRQAFVNGGEMFALQSIRTLPVATAILHLVEKGELDLEHMVRLTKADIAPGRSPLAARLHAAPVQFTIRQLLDHMLLNADGTATDALLRLAGGPTRIPVLLTRAGLKETIRVDRYERDLQPAVFGLKPDPAFGDPKRFVDGIMSIDTQARRRAQLRFLQDPRDTASPRAIVALYAALAQGHLLGRRNAALILDLLQRSKTGVDRLTAGAGKDWRMAHRSGQTRTIENFTAVFSDSGIATSRGGSRIAMAVFMEAASRPIGDLNAFQQQVARSVISAWEPPSRV